MEKIQPAANCSEEIEHVWHTKCIDGLGIWNANVNSKTRTLLSIRMMVLEPTILGKAVDNSRYARKTVP